MMSRAVKIINGEGQELWQPQLEDGRRLFITSWGKHMDEIYLNKKDWLEPEPSLYEPVEVFGEGVSSPAGFKDRGDAVLAAEEKEARLNVAKHTWQVVE